MRILFISPRPFGLMGTPGTYLLVEAYAEIADVFVIAEKKNNTPFEIVHSPSQHIELYTMEFGRPDCSEEISRITSMFDPDIINITSHRGWYDLVDFLKRDHPDKQYVYDIKSPLLMGDKARAKKRIQKKGSLSAHCLDLILTRSAEDVTTWIPECNRPVVVYPLGARIENYRPQNPEEGIPSCRRFVFIGSISPLRRIDLFLRYISDLKDTLKEKIQIDIYGSGPYEKKMIDEVHNLKLSDTVSFKGCVDSEKMPEILGHYDAGIAWVPKQLYDTAPSLKIVEFVAAGLKVLATDTKAHERFAASGFDISFYSDSQSFSTAVTEAFFQGFPKHKRVGNIEKSKQLDWSHIVKKHIYPVFLNIMGLREISETCKFEAECFAEKKNDQTIELTGRQRILFLSPRPFGLLGTPGTYLLSESYGKFSEIRIVANKKKKDKKIVYYPESSDHLYEMDFGNRQFLKKLDELIKHFLPEVIIIGNYAKWFDIVAFIKRRYPDVICVMDIKSPLMVDEGQGGIFREIQNCGRILAPLLDLVMTYSNKNVDTWMPGCNVPVLKYPIGIRTKDYKPIIKLSKVIKCKKFVFIGTIHPFRKLDVLLNYISELPENLKEDISFDFFGSGPAENDLKRQAERLGIADLVKFKGYLEAGELQEKIVSYDAGIAWVPHGLYENAPSLKLIEYMAAGIMPIAMDTLAHKEYADEGFFVEFFEDSVESFVTAIQNVCKNGISSKNIQSNLERINIYDWDTIASETILPTFAELVEASKVDALRTRRTRKELLIAFSDLERLKRPFAERLRYLISISVTNPGFNTLKLPFRLMKLVFGVTKSKIMGYRLGIR